MNHIHDVVKVSAHDVHLIDVNHTRDVIFICLTPNSLGLGLNAALGAQYCYRTVENSQGTLNFDSKVNVTRSVDNVDTVAFPETRRSGGGNCDTSLLLLLHPVHGGSALMGFTYFIVYAGVVEQYTLCCGGLTSINMRHDADISCFFKWDTVLAYIVLLSVAAKIVVITSGSGRMPCWIRPSYVYLHVS